LSNEENPPREQPLVSRVPIRVAQLGELNAYVIYEHELDKLDKLDADLSKDPPESVYLNFALFLLPISLSFVITLLTTTIRSDRTYELFVIISVLAFILSLLLFALWGRDRRSYRKTRQALLHERTQQIQRIKSRLPPNPQAVRISEEQ